MAVIPPVYVDNFFTQIAPGKKFASEKHEVVSNPSVVRAYGENTVKFNLHYLWDAAHPSSVLYQGAGVDFHVQILELPAENRQSHCDRVAVAVKRLYEEVIQAAAYDLFCVNMNLGRLSKEEVSQIVPSSIFQNTLSSEEKLWGDLPPNYGIHFQISGTNLQLWHWINPAKKCNIEALWDNLRPCAMPISPFTIVAKCPESEDVVRRSASIRTQKIVYSLDRYYAKMAYLDRYNAAPIGSYRKGLFGMELLMAGDAMQREENIRRGQFVEAVAQFEEQLEQQGVRIPRGEGIALHFCQVLTLLNNNAPQDLKEELESSLRGEVIKSFWKQMDSVRGVANTTLCELESCLQKYQPDSNDLAFEKVQLLDFLARLPLPRLENARN